MTGGAIRLIQLEKSFGGVPAVTGIDLDIPAGQFYSLLGPSGCGQDHDIAHDRRFRETRLRPNRTGRT
jgi:ABC-type transporter Mla maintaining outer membrane lipid asymmetry ATPase subunit MlaF